MRTPSTETGLHPVITTNSFAMWVCDRGTGNTVYDIINGRDVTDSGGAATWRPGRIGKAVDTSTRGFVRALAGSDNTFASGFWSCEAWVRPTTAAGVGAGGSVVEYSNSGALGPPFQQALSVVVDPDLKVAARWMDAGGANIIFASNSTLAPGVWSHIVVEKYDRGAGVPGVRIQINGVLDATSAALAQTGGAALGNWRVGVGYSGTFSGEICSAHITAATITTEQAETNWRRGMTWQNDAQGGHGINYLDVYATTALGGISQNLCEVNYGGVTWDFVNAVNITETSDNGAATATIQIKRNIYELNLSPTVNSPLNQFPVASPTHPGPDGRAGQDILVPGTAITIFAKRVPNQYNDPNQVAITTDALIFQGTIDSVDWAQDLINVECIDQGALLIDTYIEEEAAYNTPAGSSSVEAAMQLILNNNLGGAAPTLYTPTTPGWTIGPWKQRREAILQALQSLADQIGWVVKYKWDPLTSSYRLTLHDPLREQTRYDGIITTKDYTEITRIAQSLTNVRNVVRITFSDATQQTGIDSDGNPTYERNVVERSHAASISKYGRRFMEISESASSNIDTEAEANAMADAILRDLRNPEVMMDLDIPYWEIEVGDRLLFHANDTTFDTNRTFAVMGKGVSFSNNRVDVSLQLKDAPASGVQRHIVKEAGPGQALPPTYDPQNSPVDFGFRGYYAPIKNLMEAANLLQQAPSLANVPNPAMLTMPAPRVNPPTGWTHSGTWNDLASGGDVYFSTTSETGDRSLALNTVNAEATSFYTPVIGGQSYKALCTWQAPDLGDQLEISVLLYNASRVLTGSAVLFSGAPAVVNTWQTDGAVFPCASTDRFARFKVKKAAGPPILVDRVELSVMQQAADCYTSGAIACGAGTTTIVWNKTTYNYDGFYNSANGQFTASRQGTYRFSVYTFFAATVSGTLAILSLGINLAGVGVIQSSTKEFASGSTQGDHWFHTAPVQLNRGDIVTFELTVAAAGTLGAGATTCVGYRVNDTER